MNGTMKQAMLFGVEDIRIIEQPIPDPGPGEVLVKKQDLHHLRHGCEKFQRGYPLLKPPHPYGHEFSGVVAAVGAGVEHVKEGDRVACHNTAPCGRCYYCKHGQPSMCETLTYCRGTYAEYVKVPAPIVAQNMFVIPDSLSHKAASLMEPFSCAVYGIENCPIALGDFVVVNGAGPIGLMFARLAVLRGAKVLVTDMVPSRLETARRLGVWKALDLTGVEDTVAAVRALTDRERGADVVIEATGLIQVWETSVKMARKGGFVPPLRRHKGGQRAPRGRHPAPLLPAHRQGRVPHHPRPCGGGAGAAEAGGHLGGGFYSERVSPGPAGGRHPGARLRRGHQKLYCLRLRRRHSHVWYQAGLRAYVLRPGCGQRPWRS